MTKRSDLELVEHALDVLEEILDYTAVLSDGAEQREWVEIKIKAISEIPSLVDYKRYLIDEGEGEETDLTVLPFPGSSAEEPEIDPPGQNLSAGEE